MSTIFIRGVGGLAVIGGGVAYFTIVKCHRVHSCELVDWIAI